MLGCFVGIVMLCLFGFVYCLFVFDLFWLVCFFLLCGVAAAVVFDLILICCYYVVLFVLFVFGSRVVGFLICLFVFGIPYAVDCLITYLQCLCWWFVVTFAVESVDLALRL